MITHSVNKISLQHFRNYSHVAITANHESVVLVGENGAGKTNILEAISLLTAGRGLRRSLLSEMDTLDTHHTWSIYAEIIGAYGVATIGTARDSEKEESADKRLIKIDGKLSKSHTDLAKLISILWLTPQMDSLFIEGNTARRKFIDRLVFSFDSEHATRINAYDLAMRERNKLLSFSSPNTTWLSALEQKMAEQGVAIAIARQHMLEHLNSAMHSINPQFPRAYITICSAIAYENGHSALALEDEYRALLRDNRAKDAISGRTLEGVHRDRVEVQHVDKKMPAEQCSTGEQKALLISIILSQARAGTAWEGRVPVLLLDEVASHLDSNKRHALFDEITALGAQAWMTGTDREIFTPFSAQILTIHQGKIIA